MRKLLFIISIGLLFISESKATHIVGGQLNYTYLGNDLYRIELTVYRDCFNGIPPFDNPASIGVFDFNNSYLFQILLPFTGSDTVPPTVSSPCLTPPVTICYETTTYSDTILLPPLLGGYQLSYQRCCRNQTILNIFKPVNTGATFYANLPLDTIHANNSNPLFNAWPPPFICANIPFTFDHSATDAEGDSLVYEICTPLDGASQVNPVPQPPFNPPYSNVVYQAPYSIGNVMGGVPLSINPNTGLLTATPSTIGQFVIGVCVSEYRNGILLSTTRRDYQLNVVPCPSYVLASFQNVVSCGNNTIQFNNQSGGAVSYFWDFGDNGTLADTSSLYNPTYTYQDTGLYSVMLIGYSLITNCHDTAYGTVHILPEHEAFINFQTDPCSYSVQFSDSSSMNGSGTPTNWTWDFGDNQFSNQSNPIHNYNQAGSYSVSLISTSHYGCVDTAFQQVTLDSILNTSLSGLTMPLCNGDCNGSVGVSVSGSTGPYSYLWNDPFSQTTPIASNLCAGNYIVQVSDSFGCIDTINFQLPQPDLLTALLVSSDAYCGGWCIGSATAIPNGGISPYTYMWNDPQMQQTAGAVQLCPGSYQVLISDSNLCTYTDSIVIDSSSAIPPIQATASMDTILLGNSVVLNAIPSGVYSVYSWSPNENVVNPLAAQTQAFPTTSTMFYLQITDSNGCMNIDSVWVVVLDPLCIEPDIYIPNTFSPNNDGINDLFFISGYAITEMDISIYNRWGEEVFKTSNPKKAWDGKHRGKIMAPQVLVYHLSIKCYNGETFFKKGNITLLR